MALLVTPETPKLRETRGEKVREARASLRPSGSRLPRAQRVAGARAFPARRQLRTRL